MADLVHASGRPAALADLRAAVARLEHGRAAAEAVSISFSPKIDRALPGGGLSRAAFHDVLIADPGATIGFCALVMARAAGPIIWIAADPDIWPQGVQDFGLSLAELILITAKRPKDGLWAFEEALRSPGVVGAVLMLSGPIPDLVAGRRLQLAAETGGFGLLMLPDTDCVLPSAARSRWRVGAAPAQRPGEPCWSVELLRASGGRPASWTVTWDRDAQGLAVAEDHDRRLKRAGHGAA